MTTRPLSDNADGLLPIVWTNDDIECGIPDMAMFALDPKALRRFDEERASIEAMHTFEAQVEMLAAGQRVWRKVFGEDSLGFQPGWGAAQGWHRLRCARKADPGPARHRSCSLYRHA